MFLMKNVVSFSLWGTHPMYWKGSLENVRLVNQLLPGWICRFYVDASCDKNLINSIKGENVEVFLFESKDSFHGMFARFLAADDPEVDIMLSRDCDSRIDIREISAINEWLASDKDFHIMRDHPYHGTAILGGLWGVRNGLLRNLNITKLISEWNRFERKGIDQDFLGQVVYPLIKHTAFEHSEFGLKYDNEIHPFPTARVNYSFAGEIYNEDNTRQDHWTIIRGPA